MILSRKRYRAGPDTVFDAIGDERKRLASLAPLIEGSMAWASRSVLCHAAERAHQYSLTPQQAYATLRRALDDFWLWLDEDEAWQENYRLNAERLKRERHAEHVVSDYVSRLKLGTCSKCGIVKCGWDVDTDLPKCLEGGALTDRQKNQYRAVVEQVHAEGQNPGSVYVIVNLRHPDENKIGRSGDCGESRRGDLQTGNAGKLAVAFEIRVRDCGAVEKEAHRILEACRLEG